MSEPLDLDAIWQRFELSAELDRLRDLAEKAKAWRRVRDFTYRPGEINPHLLAAHQEDLDLAAAVDRLYPPAGES